MGRIVMAVERTKDLYDAYSETVKVSMVQATRWRS